MMCATVHVGRTAQYVSRPWAVPLRHVFRGTAMPSVDVLLGDRRQDGNPARRRWLREVLGRGDALVILDGFDELSEASRGAAEAWLDDLLTTYPDSHYFATSRPEGLRGQWFASCHFRRIELRTMEPEQARECVANETSNTEQRERLKEVVRRLSKEEGDVSSLNWSSARTRGWGVRSRSAWSNGWPKMPFTIW